MPRDMKELSGRILEAFDQVATGELLPDRAHAMARLASVYVQLHQAGEVERRLEALEAVASGRLRTLEAKLTPLTEAGTEPTPTPDTLAPNPETGL